MDSRVRERACALFGALSHPGRLRVVELLVEDGEHSVNEIALALSIGQSSASQYLGQLTRSGVLTVSQHGSARLYSIRGPRIVRILQLIEEFCRVHDLYGFEEATEIVAGAPPAQREAVAAETPAHLGGAHDGQR